jgi:hypothetical protein
VTGRRTAPEQRAVALADHERAGVLRQRGADRLAEHPDLAQVAGFRAVGVRLPGPAPLGLEGGAVAGEQLGVRAAGHQGAEAALTVVVDEHVLGDDQPQPAGPYPLSPVVVLEQTGAEALVELADPLEDLAPERRAEHRQDRQVEHLAGVRGRPVPRGGTSSPYVDQVAGISASLPQRLVTGTDGTHLGVEQVTGQAGQRARRHHGVVVEQHEDRPASLRQPGVDPCGEAEVAGLGQQPDAVVGGRQRRDVLGGAVG